MINVSMIIKCERCRDLAKINHIYIQEENEETYFVKEYLCDCGCITKHLEVINYTL